MDRKEKQQLWDQNIQAQKQSGLSQKQWCQEKDISYHTFKYWKQRTKISSQQPSVQETSWVSLKKTEHKENKSTFKMRIGNADIEITEPTEEMIHSVVKILMQHVS